MEDSGQKVEAGHRQYRGPIVLLPKVIAAGACLFCLLYAGGAFSYFEIYLMPAQFNAIFLAAVLTVLFLVVPPSKHAKRGQVPWYDVALILASLASCLYVAVNALEISSTARLVASPLEIGLGLVLMAIILEAVRRSLGWSLVAIGLFFFIYIKFGDLFPGMFSTYPRTWSLAIADVYLSTQGLFGSILGMASSVIIVFIAFGVFFMEAKGGSIFMNLALSLVGWMRGGPAKAAIVGSALFGTISGSPMANAAVIGSVTIPLMKDAGYQPEFAGAVESVASTGGAIMPPIMGAVAFVMADMISLPYSKIALAATIPAVLYFVALFVQTDLRAARERLHGIPRDKLPSPLAALRHEWEFLLPFLALIIFLFVLRFPVTLSGVYAILITILVSLFRKEHRLGAKAYVDSLESSFRHTLEVAVLTSLAGVIVAGLMVTGLGPRLSAALVALCGNSMLLLVILSGVVCYIMGMGVSLIVSFVLLSALVGPALVSFGVPLLAANFFIFYMNASTFFTPPFSPVTFVTGPMAGASPFRVGLQAMRLGIVCFIVPFILIYNPALLLIGPPLEVALAAVTAVIGIFTLSVGIEGYLFARCNWLQRLLFIGGGLAMIIPGWLTDLIGVIITALVMTWHWQSSRKPRVVTQAT